MNINMKEQKNHPFDRKILVLCLSIILLCGTFFAIGYGTAFAKCSNIATDTLQVYMDAEGYCIERCAKPNGMEMLKNINLTEALNQ